MHGSHDDAHILVIVHGVTAPSLHQLTVFRAVAGHLNYTRAAHDLHLSQPAVTRQVQLLEAALGVKLFAHRGRRIVLTDEGGEVLACAQRVASLLDELQQGLDARRGLVHGRLRLVATSTVGEYVLPPLIAAFRAAHPGIHVALRVANREQVLRALALADADLALMGRPPLQRGWSSRALHANELVAIAGPTHPRLGGPPLTLSELTGETLFLRESGSGTRLAVEAFLRGADLAIDVDTELGSDGAIKQAVMAGLGISILSRQAIELEVGVGRLAILPVEGLPLRRQWFLVEPADGGPPAARAFSLFLQQAIAHRS